MTALDQQINRVETKIDDLSYAIGQAMDDMNEQTEQRLMRLEQSHGK